MKNDFNIGNNIRIQRKKSGLTQEKLAEYSGLSINFISKLERTDGQNISIKKLKSIADTLGVNIISLIENNLSCPDESSPKIPPSMSLLFKQLNSFDYDKANKISKHFSMLIDDFNDKNKKNS
ncbi:hypothetical protein JCM15457_1768 [Liquorilactobacillus sucicola DSM 21376 = JCM 15457]|uniref:helix-turn-helix domain-containing protein n=1 Tax=Liquorilactobacillus sucicola TaxID=519050 RepID=UPI0004350103|nr:helix-turn-helix transcriptional regulator [Liquorilactobacillus sucicola]GAJ26818.1 hypothetical protein JCM15457_1768 [Liquorilactobacillus sucicola DSM 21376 = JCM 15457]